MFLTTFKHEHIERNEFFWHKSNNIFCKMLALKQKAVSFLYKTKMNISAKGN